MIRKFIPVLLSGLLIVQSLAAGDSVRSSFRWSVDSLSARVDGDSVDVVLGLGFPVDAVARDRAVVLRPSVEWEGGSFALRPVSVYRPAPGGRTPRLYALEGPASGDSLEIVMESGRCDSLLLLRCRMPRHEGMNGGMTVRVDMQERGVGSCLDMGGAVAGRFVRRAAPSFSPVLFLQEGSRVSGVGEVTVPLDVLYAEGASAVDESLPGNAEAVCSFVESCALVSSVPGVRVRSAEVRTWTGIVGGSSANRRLSVSRAADLARLLSGSGRLGGVRISSKGMGEDWDSVSGWLESTAWWSDGRVQQILRTAAGDPDGAERRLRLEYPLLWDTMDGMLFGGLSRSDCVLQVQAGPYDESDLAVVYGMNSALLSVYDHVRLARTYMSGSYPWCDVLLSCAQSHPDDPVAAFNAASALLTLGRTREAVKWIRRCPGIGEDMYLKAVWLIMTGSVQEGAELLGRVSLSGRGGVLDAAMASVRKMVEYAADPEPWDAVIESR